MQKRREHARYSYELVVKSVYQPSHLGWKIEKRETELIGDFFGNGLFMEAIINTASIKREMMKRFVWTTAPAV